MHFERKWPSSLSIVDVDQMSKILMECKFFSFELLAPEAILKVLA